MQDTTLPPNPTPPPSERPTLRRRLLTGTLWSMLGIAALGLTRLVYTALIGRTGPPERLAEVNAQISLAFVATFVTASATGAAAAKFLPLTTARSGPGAAATIRRKLSRWTAFGTLAVALVVVPLGYLVLPSASRGGPLWVALLVLAYGGYTFTKSVLYGHHLAGRYAVLEVGADAAMLLLTVIMVVTAVWLPGVLLAPLILGYAGFAVAAVLSTPRAVPEPLPDLGREVGGFVAYTALGIVASQGFFQTSMLVALHLPDHATSGAEAGVYAAAISLVTPAFFLPRAIALAFMPAAAEAVGHGDLAALASQTAQLTRLLWLTMLPVFAIAAMVGGPVMRLVYGPAYDGEGVGGAVLAVLLAAVLLYVVGVPSVNVLSAHQLDQARIPPLASTVGVLVGIVVWLTVGVRLGAVGIAVGYFAGLVVQAGTPLVMAYRRLGLRVRVTPRGVAAPIAAAGLTVVAVMVPHPVVVPVCVVGFAGVYALLHGRELRTTLSTVRTQRRPQLHPQEERSPEQGSQEGNNPGPPST